MEGELQERDWEFLLERIAAGRCTPFLGPGLCQDLLPSRAEIAARWAIEHQYPFPDKGDLARVAQYLTVTQRYPTFPKLEMSKLIREAAAPDFLGADQPHTVLADLQLPVYITTNYDNFMEQALESRQRRPVREIYRFPKRRRPGEAGSSGDSPALVDREHPLVFHLCGHYEEPNSLVLTEDDYLDFLVQTSCDSYQLHSPNQIPPRIQQAVSNASLLFIGYDPTDWDFRVLFRGVVAVAEAGDRLLNITVQMPPDTGEATADSRERVRAYLSRYFERTEIVALWSPAASFTRQLSERWQRTYAPTTATSETRESHGQNVRVLLRDHLTKGFSLEEIRDLAFDLGVDYEVLPQRETKSGLARELIMYFDRRDEIERLRGEIYRQRPNLPW